MNSVIGEFRIGEDIAVALEVVAGDTAAVTSVTARMKPAKVAGNRFVLDDADAGTAMTVSSQGMAGWLVSLGHAATSTLTAGIYGVDARLVFAGAVEMTEQTGFIAITQAAVA